MPTFDETRLKRIYQQRMCDLTDEDFMYIADFFMVATPDDYDRILRGHA